MSDVGIDQMAVFGYGSDTPPARQHLQVPKYRALIPITTQGLDGNPTDEGHVTPWLKRHRERFGAAPDLAAGARGFYSAANVEDLRAGGVGSECLPQRGGKRTAARTAHEKSRRFKPGQKFRAGVEGRISVLARDRGMQRCRLKGKDRFELFIGLVVLANNLLVIGRHLASKRPHLLAA